jgi:hypothetical protein
MSANTTRSFLGGNHREVNKGQQNFEFQQTEIEYNKSTTGSGADKETTEDTIEPEEVMMVEVTWMQPYIAYMVNKRLPKDVVEARKIVQRSKAFVVVQGKLYKKSISGILQWCVTPKKDKSY